MLRFFSTGHLSRYAAILLLVVLFWIPAILNPVSFVSVSAPLFQFLSNLFGANIYFQLALVLLISIFSALVVNQLATDFEFSGRFSSLGIFFYVLLSSSIPAFLSFNPIILANIFILFLLKSIFQLPTSGAPIPVVFNSGLLIGIASLFFPPLAILLLFLWAAIFIHRLSDWRNIAASMVGVILPYLFMFTWYLWAGSVVKISINLYEEYFVIPEINSVVFSFNFLIFIFLFLIITVSAFKILSHLREKNIHLRRNLMISILYLLFTIALSFFYYKIIETTLLVAIPAALILTTTTFLSKRLKFLNLTIYILLGLIILNLYLGLAISILNI